MVPPPTPPEEISQLMQFIAEKGKNVKSPMNVMELCRQFKAESGSSLSIETVKSRIILYRLKIHEMNEFDMETKVKMIYALSAPIDAGFLNELKKVADVEVDDQQGIMQYKQNDGGLELSGKHSRVPRRMGEQQNRDMIQFLAEKSETTDTPSADKVLMREFKEKTRYTDSIEALAQRYRRVKNTIYHLTGIDKNTKIKMMFISNVKLSDEILKELRENADIEVDEERRITKYKSKDGSLELEGNHGLSTIKKSFYSERWQTIYQKANENESEEDNDEETNCQKDKEMKRIDLVRFLIERTKNATSPLSIKQLAEDYKKEFKSSDPLGTTESRIKRFRQRLLETNQFDTSTKVKMLFSLSSPIDAKLLKELQQDAIVELDESQRIKKYKANDGSIELGGDHSGWMKRRSGKTRNTKTSVINDISESEEEDENEEDSSESDKSEKEEALTSSARKNDRLQKSRISFQNKNKKRQLSENNSVTTHTRNHARMSRGEKRARISYFSSEEEPSEKGDDEESEKSEDDIAMDSETDNIDNGGDDFDYDPLSYHQENERNYAEDMDLETTQEVEKGDPAEASTKNDENLEHIGIGSKPAMDNVPLERKPEESSEESDDEESEKSDDDSSMDYEDYNVENGGNDYDFDPPSYHQYDERNYEDDMESIPAEKRPEDLFENTQEIEQELLPEEQSTCVRDLLVLLRGVVISVESQTLNSLLKKVDLKIEQMGNGNQQIPLENIGILLKLCLSMLTELAPPECPPEEESTSLRDSLIALKVATSHINHQSINSFHRELKKIIEELAVQDKKIPVELVYRALNGTISIIAQ